MRRIICMAEELSSRRSAKPSVRYAAGMPTPRAAAIDADLGWALGVVFRSYLKAVEAVVNDLPGGPRGYQILTSAVPDRPDNQAILAPQPGIDRTGPTYPTDD